jgi:hypothetical protein
MIADNRINGGNDGRRSYGGRDDENIPTGDGLGWPS